MNALRKCQCGAKPQIAEVPTVRFLRPRSGKHMRDNVRERAQCPFCGNATAAHAHRADLRREWNSAGWCGQAEVVGLEAGGQRSEVRGSRDTVLVDDYPPYQWGKPRFNYSIISTPRDHDSPFEVFAEKEGGSK